MNVKTKKVVRGKCQNANNPFYARQTVTRSEETAFQQLHTSVYKKGGEMLDSAPEGVPVYPKHY